MKWFRLRTHEYCIIIIHCSSFFHFLKHSFETSHILCKFDYTRRGCEDFYILLELLNWVLVHTEIIFGSYLGNKPPSLASIYYSTSNLLIERLLTTNTYFPRWYNYQNCIILVYQREKTVTIIFANIGNTLINWSLFLHAV